MIKISTYIKVFFFIFIILVSNSLFAKKAAIVMDYETKEVLFEVNADTLYFPASLTKIMTLYIVFDYIHKDNLNWQTQLKVSKFAASESPSKLYLEAGTSISVEDAVMALIVKSANDVATVVAENISGTEKEFAKLMTSYARKLGMNKTTFKNAHGLPDRAQMTTARDIATLSNALIENFPKAKINRFKFFHKGRGFWEDKQNHRIALLYLGEQLGFKKTKDWYAIQYDDFEKLGLSSLISQKGYNHSPEIVCQ